MTRQQRATGVATGVATGIGIAGIVLAALLGVAGWLIGRVIGPLQAAPLTLGALTAWAVAAVFGGLAVLGLLVDDRAATAEEAKWRS